MRRQTEKKKEKTLSQVLLLLPHKSLICIQLKENTPRSVEGGWGGGIQDDGRENRKKERQIRSKEGTVRPPGWILLRSCRERAERNYSRKVEEENEEPRAYEEEKPRESG